MRERGGGEEGARLGEVQGGIGHTCRGDGRSVRLVTACLMA